VAATERIELPEPLARVFEAPRGERLFRGAWGGRGSGKSYGFALMAAVWGYAEPLRILCTRELQVSIKESMHAELRGAIGAYPWLSSHYEVGESFIRGTNGTEFLFRGLRHNMSAIKSMSGIDLCIVEEAEDVPEASWRDLAPTIRAPGSEIWAIWNPCLDGSPVDTRLRKSPPERSVVVECQYWDNPWFPARLEAQRQDDQRRLDPATYAWIWEGAYLENSDAQVLAGKVRVDEFTPGPDWDGPYYGVDWGFSQDPTAGLRVWVNDQCLYIEHEALKVGLDIDRTPAFLMEHLPGIAEHVSRADSARPETISYCRQNGLRRMTAVDKWPGSVEDGIAHLRGYREIIVHPRCREFMRESRLYSYKVDRLTGDVLPKVVDAHNHLIDAGRYALAPLIRQRGNSYATAGDRMFGASA
jgi:phage terminase large subunit